MSSSSVHGICQARILEWAAISRDSSQPRDYAQVSCVSCIGSGFFANAPSGEPPFPLWVIFKVLNRIPCAIQ